MIKYDVKSYALYLLKFKDRSESYLISRLIEKGYPECDVRREVQELKKKHIIDDQRLAKSIIRTSLKIRHWGKRRIKLKLMEERVSDFVVQSEIEKIDMTCEIEVAKEAVKIWKKGHKKSSDQDRKKLFAFLSRKGFGWDIISLLEL